MKNLDNSFCNLSHVPYRVRVRLARKRNEDEDSPHKLYTLVTFVPVLSFKGNLWIYSVKFINKFKIHLHFRIANGQCRQ